MPITTSTIVEDAPQIDGRRHVRERHIDNLGRVQEIAYMAESGANATTTMNARVASLDAAATASEIEANVREALGDEF